MLAYYHYTTARNGYCPLSGRRESNPVYTNPNRAYYRYTTARYMCGIATQFRVHLVGFEPTTFRM